MSRAVSALSLPTSHFCQRTVLIAELDGKMRTRVQVSIRVQTLMLTDVNGRVSGLEVDCEGWLEWGDDPQESRDNEHLRLASPAENKLMLLLKGAAKIEVE